MRQSPILLSLALLIAYMCYPETVKQTGKRKTFRKKRCPYTKQQALELQKYNLYILQDVHDSAAPPRNQPQCASDSDYHQYRLEGGKKEDVRISGDGNEFHLNQLNTDRQGLGYVQYTAIESCLLQATTTSVACH
ncbi:uncharacterized protein LOC127978859 isoform X2 [Carassius gibelio]|uniref:uncharacterized protein LOC127978859 isoform X2 n=1 Tax=Carassius gibelio TaxID=101364 RepID=UPI00227787AD|nr:uncharacterized protein LOC127978859 isoform X2 [Carassius gibelio]